MNFSIEGSAAGSLTTYVACCCFSLSDWAVSIVPGFDERVTGIGAGFCYFFPGVLGSSLGASFSAC